MKKIGIITLLFLNNLAFSHGIESHDQSLKIWKIEAQKKQVEGSFYMLKDKQVYLENHYGNLINYSFSQFSEADQKEILVKQHKINLLNHELANLSHSKVTQNASSTSSNAVKIGLFSVVLFTLGVVFFSASNRSKRKKFIPIISFGFILFMFSFTIKKDKHPLIEKSLTDPAFLDSAFVPFAPNVNTFYDDIYYYVESKGIPATHEMMVGISNHGWQQQVPIPQCYIGNNAWSIPLNPVVAATPVPVNASHFLRGAIAVAVNGVPIFNVHTNTGVDSYLDGQLDNYGGHCGRGDDYHYHIAPLHLYNYTAATKPIAFALDGFAIYGSVEPDGTVMETLDANHGHVGTNGVYHYHGTSNAPYMIGNMVGEVTEDNSLQIIPQAQASPVRTENWGPLSGALITSCTPNGTNNGYNLSYTLNGISGYATNYSWNATGLYTFKYVTPTGTTTITYNGFIPCELISTLGIIEAQKNDVQINVFPNPTNDILHIVFKDKLLENKVQSISIYSLKGDLVFKTEKWKTEIDLKSLAGGTYWLKIQLPTSLVSRQIVVR